MSKLTEAITRGREDFGKKFVYAGRNQADQLEPLLKPYASPYDILSFLNQYTTSLLQAIKEAGPEEQGKYAEPLTGDEYMDSFERRYQADCQAYNDCRHAFHSLLDEGIEASKH